MWGITGFYPVGRSLLIELITVALFLVFAVQQSRLYIRLILAPFRLLLVLSLLRNLLRSRFLLFLFVMIFIGGLVVLLVRVSSLSTQEQGVVARQFFFVSILRVLIIKEVFVFPVSDFIPLVLWLSDGFAVLLVFSILIISLLVITSLVFKFKGLVRSVCL